MLIKLPIEEISPKERSTNIDFLRGSAIFLMLTVHINAVFLKEYNSILDRLTWWGATVSFSVFLFCFAYIYGLKLSDNKTLNLKKQVKRILLLLFIYYLAAYISHYFLFNSISIDQFYSILTFEYLPVFTEFIIPFFLYIIFIFIFSPILRKLLKRPIAFILTSFIIYFLGGWLYTLNVEGPILNVVKTLMVGNGQTHSYGVLSYFPILIFGLIVGGTKKSATGKSPTLLIFMLCSILFVFLRISGLSTWNRFPPSILFLLYGIIYSFGVILLYKYIRKVSFLNKYFVFLGKRALFIFFINVIVILGLSSFLNHETFAIATVWLLQFLIIISISLVTYFYEKVATVWQRKKI
jgi:peptidoglycan/LPS O-acetylase OafA/YrhL